MQNQDGRWWVQTDLCRGWVLDSHLVITDLSPGLDYHPRELEVRKHRHIGCHSYLWLQQLPL